jgi:hypothetical protein
LKLIPKLRVKRLQISLNELKVETHHRGCFVTAKTITTPYQFADVITVIEDENGNVARFVIGFQDDSLSISGPALPINSTVAIEDRTASSPAIGTMSSGSTILLILLS